MKINRTFNLIRTLALTAGGITSLGVSAHAAAFTYNAGDLTLGFRETGSPDLVVDIGSPAIYDAVPAGTTISVTNLSAALNYAYSSVDSLNWTVTGAWRTSATNYPLETIWATAARANVGTQSAPWASSDQFAQGNPASQIASIGINAATYGSIHPANSTNNTAALVVIPNSDPNAYTPLIEDPFNKADGDLGGLFPGDVENTTPFDFDSGEPLSISDLYELKPAPYHTAAAGKWVGYFSFTPDGNVTFTAATVGPHAPTITSVVRNGNVTTVSFTTSANSTYGLLVTGLSGLYTPKSTWTATGGTVTGTGSVLSLQDTNSSSASFYVVTAH
jgi:hypothetical protein